MSKENILMSDFDFTLIGDYFKDLDRQGPCSIEITQKALSFIPNLSDITKIADIGCGTGGQTLTLARQTNAHITAVDLLPHFVQSLKQKVKQHSYENRITVLEGSMHNLPFEENEFDLICAEGAIYHIGYRKGLRDWRKYLKKDGIIVVSEATWFTDKRPKEIESFWYENYDQIDTIPNKVRQMQDAGYIPVAHFIMPEQSWWNYFNPIEKNYEPFLKKHNHSAEAELLIRHFKEEIELYKKYKEYYGYVFYIGQKSEL